MKDGYPEAAESCPLRKVIMSTEIPHKQPEVDGWITRFLSGDISREEFDCLKAWVNESPAHAEYARGSMQVLFASNVLTDNNPADVEKAFARICRRMDPPRRMRRLAIIAVVAVAAVAALLLVVVPMLTRPETPAKAREWAVYATSANQKRNIRLADGTRVVLYPHSELRVPNRVVEGMRMVYLQGEAYFNVKHTIPQFCVRLRSMDVVDKGTEFKLRDYPTEEYSVVELYSGKIELRNTVANTTAHDIKPGEHVAVEKATGRMERTMLQAGKQERANVQEAGAGDGMMEFEDATLGDVAKALGEAYGVRISVTPDAASMRFNGSFNTKVNSVEDVLRTMSCTEQIGYSRVQGGFRLYAKEKAH